MASAVGRTKNKETKTDRNNETKEASFSRRTNASGERRFGISGSATRNVVRKPIAPLAIRRGTFCSGSTSYGEARIVVGMATEPNNAMPRPQRRFSRRVRNFQADIFIGAGRPAALRPYDRQSRLLPRSRRRSRRGVFRCCRNGRGGRRGAFRRGREIVEHALADFLRAEVGVVGVGEAVGFVAEALEDVEAGVVQREIQRGAFVGENDGLVLSSRGR
jgi:hypothetical protein